MPTLAGAEEVEIPAGSQNGDVVSLKGRGLPSAQGRRTGDQHVLVFVEVPKKLNNDQKKLLRQLAEIEEANVTPERKSFLDKLRDTFGVND